MKMIKEVAGEGLETFLDQKIFLFCANYFYVGKLVGVNKSFVKLADPKIVYETGPFTDKTYKFAESLNVPVLYVRTGMIESYCAGK